MNKKGVKYLQAIKFSQLTLAKKTEIKNFSLCPIELILNHKQAENKFKWACLNLLHTLNVFQWLRWKRRSALLPVFVVWRWHNFPETWRNGFKTFLWES